MGQLGIIHEATLAITRLPAAAHSTYPINKSLIAPALGQLMAPAGFEITGDERLFWFTLFVPAEQTERAQGELARLEQRHSGTLRYAERYRYSISYRGRVAPLVYPLPCSFTATGAWGWLANTTPQAVRNLEAFDRDFMSITAANPKFRRYIQSELSSGPDIYEKCFGAEVYQQLRRLKAQLDPKWLLNRGSVFSYSEDGHFEHIGI